MIIREENDKALKEWTENCVKKQEAINHPSHYAEGRKYEPIEVIADWQLDFALGNTVKYISRAGRKGSATMSDKEKTIQDLEKAKWYLDWEIQHLKAEDN